VARLTSRAFSRSRRAKRALDSAQVLEDVVANQLTLVSRLPEDGRRRAADFLAELVMLAQHYRHYAAGWISRKELEQRGFATMRRLAAIRQSRPSEALFTERD
jgi:hypothetical protein